MSTRSWRLVVTSLAVFALAASAQAGGGRNITYSADDDLDRHDCAALRITFDGEPAARAEVQRTFPASAIGTLQAHMPESSGIRVAGWDRGEWSFKTCKAAESAEMLDRIAVSVEGGTVGVRGPARGDWLVYLLVRAPRGAALDLEVDNGPVAVVGISGDVKARTTNGPLSFKDCGGAIHARAENGPISLKRCGGRVDARAVNGPIDVWGERGNLQLRTENGPISVSLEGDSWEGGELDARAVNGPLSLKIPDNYRSTVRVEASGHSPMSCRSDACRSARKDWDEDAKWVEFGDGPPVVRLSTVNGPVSVKSR